MFPDKEENGDEEEKYLPGRRGTRLGAACEEQDAVSGVRRAESGWRKAVN